MTFSIDHFTLYHYDKIRRLNQGHFQALKCMDIFMGPGSPPKMKSTPIKAFVLVMALAAGWLVSMASAQNEATTTPVASSPTTTAAPTTTTAGTTATTSAATATPAAASRAAAGPDSAARGPGAPTENAEDLPEEEECEEAWDYIEFLKTKIK